MIYLSAQPAEIYFQWQIEIQVFNFNRLGIPKESIHILFGYSERTGIKKGILELREKLKDKANVYFYEDTRPVSPYQPTIRPHIIKKHFESNSWLNNEIIFYHDSDIIFRKLPDFKLLNNDNVWYVSNTVSYIGSRHISECGHDILWEMCDIVGVDYKQIVDMDSNSGGAQYVLKNVNYLFWEKVEFDSHDLYLFLSKNKAYFQKSLNKAKNLDINYIDPLWLQEWCSDMWAVLWNGVFFGHQIVVHDELNFCWPRENIQSWDKCNILHNAGVSKADTPELFYKGEFANYSPFYSNFKHINPEKCSSMYINEMYNYLASLRKGLNDVTFVFLLKFCSESTISQTLNIIKFLSKSFVTNFCIIECDIEQKINHIEADCHVDHYFIHDNSDEKIIGDCIINKLKSISTILFFYEIDAILDSKDILNSINLVRDDHFDIISPYTTYPKVISSSYVKSNFYDKHDIELLLNGAGSRVLQCKNFNYVLVVAEKAFEKVTVDSFDYKHFKFDNLELITQIVLEGLRFGRSGGSLYLLSDELVLD